MTAAYEFFAQAEAILLDFDGPMCSAFTNASPEDASRAAVQSLRARGIDLPADWASRRDPHELLRDLLGVEAIKEQDLLAADQAICSAELLAARGAIPTDGLLQLLRGLGGRPWAIVSNNCTHVLTQFLTDVGLAASPNAVIGRIAGQPQSLTPAPTLLNVALHELGVGPGSAILVGDSTADVWAGSQASVPVIGYANKPGKAVRLAEAGAAAVISRLTEMLPDRPCDG